MKKGIHYFTLILLAFFLMIGGTACMIIPEEPKLHIMSGVSSTPEIHVKSDKEIVEAIFGEWYDSLENDEIVIWANDAMVTAEELSGKLFGKITSEEDAKEKAEAAWVELDWCDDIEDGAPYKIKFYEEYGVWMVDSFSPENYVDSEGREYPPSLGSGCCSIIRSSDGKVLAAWIS